MIPVEKPGSPSEILEHHGIKGMRWGVRSSKATVTDSKTGKTTTIESRTSAPKSGMSTKKKVAIGVGVATIAVGAAATAYYLHKNGKLPLSSIGKGGGKVYKSLDDIPKVKVSEIAQARRSVDKAHYIKLMMSSKKYAPTLEEATRIANQTYGPL